MKTSILSLLVLGLATSGVRASQLHERAASIQWGKCNDPRIADSTLRCGNIMVPRDYSDPRSEDEIRIDIVKAPATKQPVEGSIFFNWGGPGGSGIVDMLFFSSRILA